MDRISRQFDRIFQKLAAFAGFLGGKILQNWKFFRMVKNRREGAGFFGQKAGCGGKGYFFRRRPPQGRHAHSAPQPPGPGRRGQFQTAKKQRSLPALSPERNAVLLLCFKSQGKRPAGEKPLTGRAGAGPPCGTPLPPCGRQCERRGPRPPSARRPHRLCRPGCGRTPPGWGTARRQ